MNLGQGQRKSPCYVSNGNAWEECPERPGRHCVGSMKWNLTCGCTSFNSKPLDGSSMTRWQQQRRSTSPHHNSRAMKGLSEMRQSFCSSPGSEPGDDGVGVASTCAESAFKLPYLPIRALPSHSSSAHGRDVPCGLYTFVHRATSVAWRSDR